MSIPLSSFFFQAEDGIRDRLVTGVQTCALPISFEAGPHQGPEGVSNRRRRRGERSEEHTSELQSPGDLVCRLLLEKKKTQCGVRTGSTEARRPPLWLAPSR